MEKMSLREVCDAAKVSRRVIQGYESAGLVSATGRDARGYLLYGEKELEKIKKIRLFQEMGFSIKEISELMEAPKEQLKQALQKRVTDLQKEDVHIKSMIDIAQKMIESL